MEAVSVSWVQDFVPAFAEFCQGPSWPPSPPVLAELHLLPLSPCTQDTWFGVTHKTDECALWLLPGLFTDTRQKQSAKTGPGKTRLLTGFGQVQSTKHYAMIPARFSPI